MDGLQRLMAKAFITFHIISKFLKISSWNNTGVSIGDAQVNFPYNVIVSSRASLSFDLIMKADEKAVPLMHCK